MTRLSKSKLSTSKGDKTRPPKGRSGYWLLQDAKARFSELVRKARSEGPQHVTVHGRDEVVVIAAEEFRRLKGSATGQALIEAMQASPHRDIEIAPRRGAMRALRCSTRGSRPLRPRRNSRCRNVCKVRH